MADSPKLVVNLLLFSFQLLIVRQVLPLATAANAEMTTWRHCSDGTQLVELDDVSLGIAVLLLRDLQIYYIARNAEGYENHQLTLWRAVMGWNSDAYQRLAFCRNIGNGYALEYR